MKLKQIALAAAIAATGSAASAQSSNVTIYGVIDQNISYLQGGGTSAVAMEDGGFLKSRFGFRGQEDLGGGKKASFVLEGGGWANTGNYGMFNRMSWVGLGTGTGMPGAQGETGIGEFRLGLQNTATFYRGDYIDYTSRTLGSVINNFQAGFVPSRYNNDIAWLSPRINGVFVELHYAMNGTAGDISGASVTQAAIDYLSGPFRLGYTGNWFKPSASATYRETIKYDNFYANYDYGHGKVYAAYVHTNNNVASGTNGGSGASSPITNDAGQVTISSSALGSVAPGDIDIYQLSADYLVTPKLRVGALWGVIHDNTGNQRGGKGESVGAYYDLSKRTMLYSIVMRQENDSNGAAMINGSNSLMAASGILKTGVNQNIYSVGVTHKF